MDDSSCIYDIGLECQRLHRRLTEPCNFFSMAFITATVIVLSIVMTTDCFLSYDNETLLQDYQSGFFLENVNPGTRAHRYDLFRRDETHMLSVASFT